MCVCVGIRVCLYYLCMFMYVFVYQHVCLVACYSISDLIVQSKLGNGRSGFVLVVELT